MPRIPIFRLKHAEEDQPPPLASYTPSLSLEGLQLGVDNLRHDVYLSPKFVEQTRLQIARLIIRHGNVEGLLSAEEPARGPGNHFIGAPHLKTRGKAGPAEFKPLLAEIHVAALNRAKVEGKLVIDLLARLAIIKFLRAELNSQFAQMLERCRMTLKNYEGLRQ